MKHDYRHTEIAYGLTYNEENMGFWDTEACNNYHLTAVLIFYFSLIATKRRTCFLL